ncbi:class I SAM-dependent methyltransferase [Geojedonia litorea]|uniref:Class I SAM-dependent methyltransferase n=1 Tax=Geojedonia litorea TaxID=1268269 RepID=A0ABV9N0V5_9FLAO
MNKSILNIEIQDFINSNLNSEVGPLLLKGTNFKAVETREIIEQIEAKKKCETKLPTWFKTPNIYYPNKLNIEQTSSELTATYKSQLVQGQSLIDITGGFGVDCYYFSKHIQQITHCEIDNQLSIIVNYNFKQLNASSIVTQAEDGLTYLKNHNKVFDWIYVDPSRRHETKGKVFFLSDCLPNVPKYLTLLFKRSNNILIKTSPLLDISAGLSELKQVKCIHVVAVNNEAKELLWFLEKNYDKPVGVKTVNLTNQKNETFNFLLNDEPNSEVKFSNPLTYLYEPNAAILKSGAFKSLSKQLGVAKLHINSHLYTSDELLEFPGRRFMIENVLQFNKKAFKALGMNKANITTRNFPETVSQLRKKFKIGDGGNHFLFFTTTGNNEKIVVVCTKV